ncbi:carbohydrate binding domain-containing protein [Neobacillus sp. Marseille-QA0830]
MKTIHSFIVFLCAILVLQLLNPFLLKSEAAQNPGSNLQLANAGFEEPFQGGKIPGWTQTFGTTGISVVDTEKYAGEKSLEIKDNSKNDNYGEISQSLPVNSGWVYTASAKMKTTSTGTGEIYLRFFDKDGKYMTGTNQTLKGPASWADIKVTATAPEGAAQVAVLLYSAKGVTGTFYFDDVSLTEAKPIVPIQQVGKDLGIQVSKTTVMMGDIGKDKNGNDVLYTVVAGAPAKFAIVDINTEQVVKSYPLEDTSGAWAVKVASDGTVYLGAYNKGYLYRYLPETDQLVNLGFPVSSSDAVLYPMDISSDGKIYGGTYGSGSVYQYDPANGQFTSYGTMVPGQGWVRSVALDEENHVFYAGVGNKASLIQYNLDTGEKKDILPEQYSDIISVYDMKLVDGKLFGRKEANYEMFVLDTKTGELVEAVNGDTGEKSVNIPASSRGISEKSPIANKIYFTHNGILFEYNLDNNTYKNLGADLKGSAVSYKFVQLKEDGFPGYSLVGLSGNSGKVYKYNLETGKLKLTDVTMPSEPALIHDLLKGPDGKIYSTGYLPGNMGAYLPTMGKNINYDGIGQSEGMTILNNKMYLGLYPNAKIYEFDPFKEWNRVDSNQLNPNLIFSLEKNEDIPGYTPQDRPFAMLGVDEYNKLFIGTVPKNGFLGGAFAIYTPGSQSTPVTHWNLVKDQSIVTLAYKDGKVYGGTTIAGGQGSVPTTTEGKVFIWDIEKNEKTAEFVPVPGKRAVSELKVGPDGKIWGMADGTLFSLDPANNQVDFAITLDEDTTSNWRNATLEFGTDNNIYGIIGGKFFKYDTVTKQYEFLAGNVEFLAQDDFGSFYLSSGNRLYQYSDESLLVKLTKAEMAIGDQQLTVGDQTAIKLKGYLEKGRTTHEFSGATIDYEVNKPDVLSIENGVITALRSGRVEVTATITLDGVTVKTEPISVWVNNRGGINK